MVSLQKNAPRSLHVELNPWFFLWLTVCAWIWYGLLHLAYVGLKYVLPSSPQNG